MKIHSQCLYKSVLEDNNINLLRCEREVYCMYALYVVYILQHRSLFGLATADILY